MITSRVAVVLPVELIASPLPDDAEHAGRAQPADNNLGGMVGLHAALVLEPLFRILWVPRNLPLLQRHSELGVFVSLGIQIHGEFWRLAFLPADALGLGQDGQDVQPGLQRPVDEVQDAVFVLPGSHDGRGAAHGFLLDDPRPVPEHGDGISDSYGVVRGK